MSCTGCSINKDKDGSPAGCNSNGGCATGGCNRLNVYDWFADIPISFHDQFDIVEITFSNGARKGFYRNSNNISLTRDDLVVVEAAPGFDIGKVNLQGELVKLQMKKKKAKVNSKEILNIVRIAKEKDINQLVNSREKENEIMIKARVILRELGLEMKLGDVEFQGDGKKATFYYTADGRVDFRELVKRYASEFKIKIEMRQIGARQEASRIGGMGSCGRELCCSTWLTDFKSVTTNAARYQNLSINTDKLSGQCGRLKCCLNYELDIYMDALAKFPEKADVIITKEGKAFLRKTDIFKELMYYNYEESNQLYKLDIATVNDLLKKNKEGQIPESLSSFVILVEEDEVENNYEDLVGQVSLKALEKKSTGKRRNKKRRNRNQNRKNNPNNNKNKKP